jgi:hypothetical protein
LFLPDFVEEIEVDDLDTDNCNEGYKDGQDASKTGHVTRRVGVFEQEGAWPLVVSPSIGLRAGHTDNITNRDTGVV